ncbi:MAG: DUF3343 domain-containing protein [Desulfitobacteriaceae bacterium]
MQPNSIYFALFFTTSGAIKFHRILQNLNIVSEPMPVPRKLSSSCGIGVKFSYGGDLNLLYNEDIEKVFEFQGNQYILKYEN